MDLIEPMFDAVVNGEEQLILTYLSLGANISGQGDDGQNVLHWAAASPFGEQLLSFLIARGADLNAEDNMGYTPLHLHALRGRVYGTSCLLQAGAAVNAISAKNGFTPLHLAILHNHIEVANVLLAYGADYHLLDNLRDLGQLAQGKLASNAAHASSTTAATNDAGNATTAAAAVAAAAAVTAIGSAPPMDDAAVSVDSDSDDNDSVADGTPRPSNGDHDGTGAVPETPHSIGATVGGDSVIPPDATLTPLSPMTLAMSPPMHSQVNLLEAFATPEPPPPPSSASATTRNP